MAILTNYILPLCGLFLLSWLWDISSKKSEPKFKITREEYHAMKLASEIYRHPPGSVKVDGVGEINLFEGDSNTSYLVFRGTAPLTGELFKNVHLKSVLILLCFSLSFSLIVGVLPVSVSYQKIWFGLVGFILFFINSFPLSSVQTKYEVTSSRLFEKIFEGKEFIQVLKNRSIKHLYISGHSKGGAEATIIYSKLKDELRENGIKSNLVTIGAASSLRERIEDPNALNFVFKTDTVQLLNMNKYRGRVLERNPDGLFYFFLKIIVPMIIFGLTLYFIEMGLSCFGSKVPIVKCLVIGTLLPVYVIILQLILTHGHEKYVEHARLYLLNY